MSTTCNSIIHSEGERSGSDQYVGDGDHEIETWIKRLTALRCGFDPLTKETGEARGKKNKEMCLDTGELSG